MRHCPLAVEMALTMLLQPSRHLSSVLVRRSVNGRVLSPAIDILVHAVGYLTIAGITGWKLAVSRNDMIPETARLLDRLIATTWMTAMTPAICAVISIALLITRVSPASVLHTICSLIVVLSHAG